MVVGSVPTCASSRLGGAIAPVVVHGLRCATRHPLSSSVNSGGNKHLHRDIRVHASKETYVEEHKDMAVGYNVNPMKRASEDLNLVEMIGACSRWQQLKQLVDEMDEQFEKAPRLLVETVVKVADLMASSKLTPKSRASALKLVDRVCFMIVAKLEKMRPDYMINLLFALDEMEYPQPKLMHAIMTFYQGCPGKFKIAQLLAIASTCVQMGYVPSTACVLAIANSGERAMKFMTADDISNCAFAFSRTGSVQSNFLVRVGIQSIKYMEEMSGDALCHLLLLMSKVKDFRVESFWSDGFMQNIMSKAKGIRNVRSYPALLYGLSRLNMPMPTTLLEEVAAGLAAAPKGGKGGKAKAPPPLMELEAADVGVVTAVMARAMAEGFKPKESFVELVISALEKNAGNMEAPAAAAVITNFHTILSSFATAAHGSPPTSSKEDAELAAEGALMYADLLDELLAVSESGLQRMPAQIIGNMAIGLGRLGHSPDSFWMDACIDALTTKVQVPASATKEPSEGSETKAPQAPKISTQELLVLAAAMAAVHALKCDGNQSTERDEGSEYSNFGLGVVAYATALGGVKDAHARTLNGHLTSLGLELEDFPIPTLPRAFDKDPLFSDSAGSDDSQWQSGFASYNRASGRGAAPSQQGGFYNDNAAGGGYNDNNNNNWSNNNSGEGNQWQTDYATGQRQQQEQQQQGGSYNDFDNNNYNSNGEWNSGYADSEQQGQQQLQQGYGTARPGQGYDWSDQSGGATNQGYGGGSQANQGQGYSKAGPSQGNRGQWQEPGGGESEQGWFNGSGGGGQANWSNDRSGAAPRRSQKAIDDEEWQGLLDDTTYQEKYGGQAGRDTPPEAGGPAYAQGQYPGGASTPPQGLFDGQLASPTSEEDPWAWGEEEDSQSGLLGRVGGGEGGGGGPPTWAQQQDKGAGRIGVQDADPFAFDKEDPFSGFASVSGHADSTSPAEALEAYTPSGGSAYSEQPDGSESAVNAVGAVSPSPQEEMPLISSTRNRKVRGAAPVVEKKSKGGRPRKVVKVVEVEEEEVEEDDF